MIGKTFSIEKVICDLFLSLANSKKKLTNKCRCEKAAKLGHKNYIQEINRMRVDGTDIYCNHLIATFNKKANKNSCAPHSMANK